MENKNKTEDAQKIKPIATGIQTVIPLQGGTCFIPDISNTYKILKLFGFWGWIGDRLDIHGYLYSESYKKLDEKVSVCYRTVYGHLPFECKGYGDGICVGVFLLQGVDWAGRKYPHIHLIYLDLKDYRKLGYNPLSLRNVFIGYEEMAKIIKNMGEDKVREKLRDITIKVGETSQTNEKGSIKNIYFNPNTIRFVITYEGDLYSIIKYLYEDVLGDSLGYMGLINVDEKLVSFQTRLPTIALISKEDEEKVINDKYFRYGFRQVSLDSFRKFGRVYQKRFEEILYQL